MFNKTCDNISLLKNGNNTFRSKYKKKYCLHVSTKELHRKFTVCFTIVEIIRRLQKMHKQLIMLNAIICFGCIYGWLFLSVVHSSLMKYLYFLIYLTLISLFSE